MNVVGVFNLAREVHTRGELRVPIKHADDFRFEWTTRIGKLLGGKRYLCARDGTRGDGEVQVLDELPREVSGTRYRRRCQARVHVVGIRHREVHTACKRLCRALRLQNDLDFRFLLRPIELIATFWPHKAHADGAAIDRKFRLAPCELHGCKSVYLTISVLLVPTVVAQVMRTRVQDVHSLARRELRVGCELQRDDPRHIRRSHRGAAGASVVVTICRAEYTGARCGDVLSVVRIHSTLTGNVVVRGVAPYYIELARCVVSRCVIVSTPEVDNVHDRG